MQPDIPTSLPNPRPVPRSFNEALYEWMARAPWLVVSAAAHALVLIILLAIPWDLLREEKPVVVATAIEQLPDNVFEELPPEPLKPVSEPEPNEEPVLIDEDVAADAPVDDAQATVDSSGELSDISSDEQLDAGVPFEIGIGPGGGPKYGQRWTGDGGGAPGGGGAGTALAVERSLEWLAAHQSPDGSWDADGFSAQCGAIGGTTCTDPGDQIHDVGMTGLALLAFLGCGNTTRRGKHADVVRRGIGWLRSAQDPDSGLIGDPLGHAFAYDHAIAALALCEAYHFSRSPLLRRSAQDAVHWISRARNPYSAWRYSAVPNGDNDTSVTGWMVFALKAAEDAGLTIDPMAYTGALTWLNEVTDPATGRCGYDSIGSASSRIARVNEHYPAEKGEAMTAVALLCRFFMGQTPDAEPVMLQHADLLVRSLPVWEPDDYGCDIYYWYYGTYAMFQMGGARHWRPWERAMKRAVLGSQRLDGDERGSWDPRGPWGYAGGRVYATAMMTLCLEAYYRYGRLTGGR